VTLPLSEYNRLTDLARPPVPTAVPPVEAVLSSADLRVRVEESRYGLEFLVYGRTGWPHTVALPHPSPRNRLWLRRNAWFEAELLPALRGRVAAVLERAVVEAA